MEKRLIGTFVTVLNDTPIAYSVLLRHEPPYTDEWEDDDGGEMQTEYYHSECAVELVVHQVGQDPMDCKSAWVQMDYNEDAFPNVLDVEDVEWDTLFDEAGHEFKEFHSYKAKYNERVHLISNILKAVGL